MTTDVDGEVASVDGSPFEQAATTAQAATNTQIAFVLRTGDIVHQPAMGDLRLEAMKRFGDALIGFMLLASCSVNEGTTSVPTLPPIGSPSNTVPPTTATTVVATTETSIEPIAPTSTTPLPAGACVFSPPGTTADVTFEVATRLYSINPGSGAGSCLSELTADNVGPFQWSPAGDRVLLNSVTVFDGTQALPSGYFATNTGVSWSYPTGKALIAPAVADSHLLWRAAGQPETRTDISFLDHTDVARYHPAGRDIFASGQAADGKAGLFIAGNRGENPRLIAQLDQPSTEITEIAPDPSGARVFFVHDHHNGTFHVHALDLPQLTLTDITQTTEPVARLSVGTTPNASIAWRIGSCSGLTRTQVAGPGGVTDQPSAFVAVFGL